MDLHGTYSKEAAIAEFGGEPQMQMLCDGQFAVLSKVVLAFVTIGKSAGGSYLRSPSEVIWKPGRLDYAPSDEIPWFPEDVRIVCNLKRGKLVPFRTHQIFVRSAETIDYVYAGEAPLSVWSEPGGDARGNRQACFVLGKKLPRDLWLQFGGYSGWHIEFHRNEQILAPDDRAGFDGLLDNLVQWSFSNLCMTRYEEDSLTIFTNPTRAWVMFIREPHDSGLYLDDPSVGDHMEHFLDKRGVLLNFRARQTVSHWQAVKIARYFFRKGKRPASVEWVKDRCWLR